MIRHAVAAFLLAGTVQAAAETPAAREEARLMHTLTESFEKRLADGGQLTSVDLTMLKRASYLPGYSYFPVDYDAVNDAVRQAVLAEPRSDMSSLLPAAVRAITASIGHGAEVFDHTNAPPRLAEPSSRTAEDLHIVTLASFGEISYQHEPLCYKLIPLFPAPKAARAIVVDLRGNRGAAIELIRCTLGVLVAPSTPLFEIHLKDSDPEMYEALDLRVARSDLPMIAFVDDKTDNGGLLFAAVLQDLGRARIVGEQMNPDSIRSSVSNLVIFTDGLQASIPVGELRHGRGRKLTDGIRIDVPVASAAQTDVWLAAAHTALAVH